MEVGIYTTLLLIIKLNGTIHLTNWFIKEFNQTMQDVSDLTLCKCVFSRLPLLEEYTDFQLKNHKNGKQTLVGHWTPRNILNDANAVTLNLSLVNFKKEQNFLL